MRNISTLGNGSQPRGVVGVLDRTYAVRICSSYWSKTASVVFFAREGSCAVFTKQMTPVLALSVSVDD